MALMDCPNCGKQISDKACKCPYCDYENTPQESEKIQILCRECGHELQEGDETCPVCGCPVDNNSEVKENLQKVEVASINIPKMSKKRKGIIIATVSILVAIVSSIVVVASVFVFRKYNEYKYIVYNIEQIEDMRKDISDCLDWTVIKTDKGYISNDVGIRSAASKIATYAGLIGNNIVWVEQGSPHIKEETINEIVQHETINNGMYKTWEEYKNSLTKKYYLDEELTDYARANKIIKSHVDLITK